jgi:hypothetical protein
VTDLRAAGSRAVLIGTGCATGGSGAAGLAGVPAVEATVTDLATTLVDRCGMTAGNVRVVLDPALPFGVGEALAEETRRAEDAMLVYFCGHGLVSLDGNLYLATAATDTRPGYLTHTAVAYGQVRDAVLESPARVIRPGPRRPASRASKDEVERWSVGRPGCRSRRRSPAQGMTHSR